MEQSFIFIGIKTERYKSPKSGAPNRETIAPNFDEWILPIILGYISFFFGPL